jgi:hypothetical protein
MVPLVRCALAEPGSTRRVDVGRAGLDRPAALALTRLDTPRFTGELSGPPRTRPSHTHGASRLRSVWDWAFDWLNHAYQRLRSPRAQPGNGLLRSLPRKVLVPNPIVRIGGPAEKRTNPVLRRDCLREVQRDTVTRKSWMVKTNGQPLACLEQSVGWTSAFQSTSLLQPAPYP